MITKCYPVLGLILMQAATCKCPRLTSVFVRQLPACLWLADGSYLCLWLVNPRQLTMGWLRFQGKVQLWQATDLPLVFPRSLFPSEIISSLSVPAHDQMSGTVTAFPRLWLVDWAPVWPLIGPWQLCDTVSATHILWHGSIRMSGYIIVTPSQ